MSFNKIFTTSTTYVMPMALPNLRIFMIGGGASGFSSHSGAGGAGYILNVAHGQISAGTSISITIGAGGQRTGNSGNDGPAYNGGNTLVTIGNTTYNAEGGKNSGSTMNMPGGNGSSGGGGAGNDGYAGNGGSGGSNGSSGNSYGGGTGMGVEAFNNAVIPTGVFSAGAGGAAGNSSHSGGGGAGGVITDIVSYPTAEDGGSSLSGKGGVGFGAGGGSGGYNYGTYYYGGAGAPGMVYIYEMPLYAFTSHTFTNADKTGSIGPTLQEVRNKYNVTWANTYLNMINDNGIQLWTVPITGNYTIRAVGATGSNENQTTVQVGNPADMTGTFSFTGGEVIKILVGQTGWLGASRPGWGGGGGTFVTKSDDTPLIVAGGCGSGHDGVTNSGTRQNANTGTSGMLDSGTPGTWTNPLEGGGDGAGFDTDGSIGNGIVWDAGKIAVAAKSFKNGGVGASIGGGFGGGGSVTNTYGGGGGGYNGGQAGKSSSPYNGGGGGSYNSGTNQTNTLYTNGMTTMSHGFVTITTSTQLNATLTVSKNKYITKYILNGTINFNVFSTNADSGYTRQFSSNNGGVITVPSQTSPNVTIAGPGRTTINVTQSATTNYTAITVNAIIEFIIVGQNQSYTSDDMTFLDLTGTNLAGTIFNSCNLTGSDLYNTTVNANTSFSTSTLNALKSGRITGVTSLLPAGFTMI